MGHQNRALLWAASWLPAGGNQQRIETLKLLLLGLVLVVVAANVCRYFGEVFIARAVLRGLMDLRAMLYDRTLQMPMAFFAAEKTADLVTKFVQDIQEIQRGMMAFLGKFIREPLRGIFLLAIAFRLDWRITVVMVVVGPLTIAVFWAVGRKVKKANHRLLRGYGEMIGALTASLQNIRVVKAYTAEQIEGERLEKVDRRMFKQQLRLQQLQAFTTPMMETVAVIGGSMVTVWLAGRVLGGEISLSKFLTLGACLSMLFDPLRKLSDVYVRIVRSSAGADRIFAVLDATLEAEDAHATKVLGPLSGGIEYRNVRFTYPGGAKPAIDGVTLRIAEGETVALVGPNGSGKTTLAGMIPRFFDPDFGEVRFDDTNLREASLKSLRDQISLVTQDAVVFAGTPIENIGYGDARPDAERARDAARRAHADEFIEALPAGYDEILGERGTTLSGGQRQRLAIARAIYRDAPILIFDEATSQIDSESELKIQGALKSFAKGRTTVIIAHRLSTIQFADRIVVMDQGAVADSGTHAELFARCPLYRTLCETQFVNEVIS
jgi:ABC-type multidrug transport system fused ATPase/permease subunit